VTSFLGALRADLRRYVEDDNRSVLGTLDTLRREPGLQAIIVYRFGKLLDSSKTIVPLWPLLGVGWVGYTLAESVVRKGYGIRLSLSAKIGQGFYVGHFGGIEVANCTIGEYCSVGQHTKVGHPTQVDGPSIGSGVWIGAHATVRRPVKIGDHATIAPGARVVKDVPAMSLVVGDPARVVFGNYNNSRIRGPT
jgi:serine O-acetyltransferase